MSVLSLQKLGGVLLSVLTAAILFFLSFIVGLSIAADAGNMDTGMIVVFLVPFYALAAGGAALAAWLTIRKYATRLSTVREQPSTPLAWIWPLALAVSTSLGVFLALYAPLNALADRSSGDGWYLAAVACAPLWIVLPSLVGVAVFRWSWRTLYGGSFPGSAVYGLIGAGAALLAHYPALIICAGVAVRISNANDYNTNVDSFLGGILCWPFVIGPGFVLGMLGGRLGHKLAAPPDGQGADQHGGGSRLPAVACALLGGVASLPLFLLPLTIGILEEWRLY